jgi:hypothetical protein
MTDESHGMDPVEEPLAPVDREATVTEGVGDFTSGEGLVAFAGIVLIVVWLIFGVIANDYWVDWVALVPAIAAVILPRVDRAAVERYHPLPLAMKALGYTIAIVGVLVIVENIRFAGNVFDEVLGVIGALAAYAGYAMAFVGARQIKI